MNEWKGGLHEFMSDLELKALPEEVVDIIDPFTLCVHISFNKAGTILALGCNDGRVILWDFVTNTIISTLYGHVKPIQSLSWSCDNFLLCSGGMDRKVVIWDLKTRKCLQKCSVFNSYVTNSQFHPRNNNILLISCSYETPCLYNIEEKRYITLFSNDDFENTNSNIGVRAETSGFTASFNKRGEFIYVGDPKGNIIVFNYHTLNVLIVFNVSYMYNDINPAGRDAVEKFDCHIFETNANYYLKINKNLSIKSLCFSSKYKTDMVLVNCFDDLIRLYDVNSITNNAVLDQNALQNLRNINTLDVPKFLTRRALVPRMVYFSKENSDGWKCCRFSTGGSFISAIANKSTSIFIWNLVAAEPCHILHDTQSCYLTDFIWHPLYPILCCSSEGRCIVWGQCRSETWCNYEPNFRETDECVVYNEPENEFDLGDEDDSEPLRNHDYYVQKDDDTINFTNKPDYRLPYLSSDEEDGDKKLCFMPFSTSNFQK